MAGKDGIETKKIHPFFSAPKNRPEAPTISLARPMTPDLSGSSNPDKTCESADADGEDDGEPEDCRRKRRRTNPKPIHAAEAAQPATKRQARPKRQSRIGGDGSIARHFGQSRDDEDVEVVQEDAEVENKEAGADSILEPQTRSSLPLAQTPESTLNTEHTHDVDVDSRKKMNSTARPQILVKFNPKTGTFGSPPKPKPQTADKPGLAPSKPTGKSCQSRQMVSLIVHIDYGTDEETRLRIGEKIEDVMSGVRLSPSHGNITTAGEPRESTSARRNRDSETVQKTSRKNAPRRGKPRRLTSDEDDQYPETLQQMPKKTMPSGKQTPKKATHPFFTGKLKDTNTVATSELKEKPKSPAKTHSIFTSTPCSPRHARQVPPAKFNLPQFGMKTGGIKVPGAQHPSWPCQEMVHVYGDDRDVKPRRINSQLLTGVAGRKLKGQESHIPAEDSMVYHVMSGLELDRLAAELRVLSTEDFQSPPQELRIPERCFESGKKLRIRIDPELRTCRSPQGTTTHPAVAHAYNSVLTSSSAFDQSKCENRIWASKYAPTSADRVLQSGKEAELLRDWLLTLKVQAVHTGTPEILPSKLKQAAAPKKKRKRKKLDGFIVSSDEEGNVMDEISESEADWAPNGSQGGVKKTVVRARDIRGSKDNTRLTNAVVLSGPHGCGKTAAVYAIAKELDFEVFEISSSSRRSGKDILERIGDMTRNHLVQHHQNDLAADEVEGVSDDEVARDIKSGKQGMMTAFFKPKTSSQPKKKKPAQIILNSATENETKKLPGTKQKQSLILLEEVDILYEEDKQFWTTVIALMSQSKRPFIMTCNDESLVPLHSLNLYGIFRFGIPPKDAAVDLLLLIAANEGHALQRETVESLFESRSHDMRASIMELNYWCQIGVGDLKGGFGWIYRRWPAGTDVDQHGDKIRVVSAGTYRTGMGWLGRDAALVPSAYRSVQEELQQQLWENWGLEDLESSTSQTSWALKASKPDATRSTRLEALALSDSFAESMSAADICSMGSFTKLHEITMDPTQPGLSSKARDDFIIGCQFIDAPPLASYSNTSLHIASTMKNLSRSLLATSNNLSNPQSYYVAATNQIRDSFSNPLYTGPVVNRYDYSIAFDPIAASEKPLSSGNLDASVFDRNMKLLILDVAPYVRSIVAYDQRLQQERLHRSNLVSKGGKPQKRIRTTRSAYSALEGASRASIRREQYFAADINPHLVIRTGGEGWDALAAEATRGQRSLQSCASAPQSSDGEMDTSGD
ncbi:uncharacterized protein BCR38DRAFT_436883 [Pseudomassariella vexata]|uniref:AAA+ ATPase domain-containing protein n=1 Tax=Pseudomassariella vexata TaxID=1141098 RepID=A0A1Y2DVY0_9PEZI|nr:uncharacterized protein BCR38DRAFT_436883 [Pseudomassariella vexata]ORY63452.1 hypothetical protein BCR38DRAFT_436883 [Pseudomassariella vexata]